MGQFGLNWVKTGQCGRPTLRHHHTSLTRSLNISTRIPLPPANVFRMVANAPAGLQGFVQLAGSILLQSEFDPRQREMAILRIAQITRSNYEWEQHVRIARQVGVPDEVIRDIRLSEEALTQLLSRYGVRQTTELILCCAYFNMLNRFWRPRALSWTWISMRSMRGDDRAVLGTQYHGSHVNP